MPPTYFQSYIIPFFCINFLKIALEVYCNIFIYKKYFLERLHIPLHGETPFLETTAVEGH